MSGFQTIEKKKACYSDRKNVKKSDKIAEQKERAAMRFKSSPPEFCFAVKK